MSAPHIANDANGGRTAVIGDTKVIGVPVTSVSVFFQYSSNLWH
jgi:hypothetical protein